MTDPIADLITRIRNAYMAKKLSVAMPYSRAKHAVAKVLAEYDFVDKVAEEGEGTKKSLTMQLVYNEKGEAVLQHIERISKPGLRKYWTASKVPLIRGGFGMAVISTSRGVLSNYKARKQKIGGEPLVKVW